MTGAFTWHGGNLAQARARFGDNGPDWLDLSTGINPVPWPHADRLAVDWQALPGGDALAVLEAAAAQHFCVAPELCCAVPGSELALRLLGTVLGVPGQHFAPAYRTHALAFAQSCAIERFDPASGEARALLLANPNNPDGRIIPPAQLMEWHDHLAAAQGWLVVDEAFADATPEVSVAAQVDPVRRLVVLRSFGKFFGLAGVRLGFVLGPPPVIAAYRRLLGDWPLSAAAIAIGAAAYADAKWVARTRADLLRRAAALDEGLRGCGLEPEGACPQFRLIRSPNARALFERLGQSAILARPFDYAPDWLRLGVPAQADDLVRLIEALSHA